MIWPRDDLVPLSERPPLDVPGWMWGAGRLLAHLTRPVQELEYRLGLRRVSKLLKKVGRCEYRSQLEALVGPPKYAISGEGCGDQVDRFEYYVRGQCCIVLAFKNGRVKHVCGHVRETTWNIVTRFSGVMPSPDDQ